MNTDKIKTAVIAVPLILLIINWSSVSFLLMVIAVIVLGLMEFYKLMEIRGYRPQKFAGVTCGLFILLTIFLFERRLDVRMTGVVITVFLFIFFVIALFKGDADKVINSVSVTVLGVFYVAWTIAHSVLLRDMRPYGRRFIFLLFFSIWSINMIVGWVENKVTVRRRKFKSYTRLIVSALAGIAVTLAWERILNLEYFRHWAVSMGLMPFIHSIIIGLIIGISSQVGWFIKSLMKAGTGLKDGEGLFPGYGGMLDSISSFQFSVPLMYYYIRFFVV